MAKNIKEVQEINRMILDEVDRVCKKYNICYYLDCGALLGAVRHGSFIPWDDDVDITFTRDNYEKFISATEIEWKHGDFILHKPEDFLGGKWLDYNIRIVYKNDTADINTYEKVGKKAARNIWGKPALDIFILDNTPDNVLKHKIQCSFLTLYYGLAMGHRKFIDFSEYSTFPKIVIWYLSRIGKHLSRDWIIQKYNYHAQYYRKQSGHYYFYSNFPPKDIIKRRKKEWYQNGTTVSIDRIPYHAPLDYDMVLKSTYGNYMKLPPEHERVAQHMK